MGYVWIVGFLCCLWTFYIYILSIFDIVCQHKPNRKQGAYLCWSDRIHARWPQKTAPKLKRNVWRLKLSSLLVADAKVSFGQCACNHHHCHCCFFSTVSWASLLWSEKDCRIQWRKSPEVGKNKILESKIAVRVRHRPQWTKFIIWEHSI